MDFGKKIYELRKGKNITQDELAAELGVTAAAVSKWENGYTLPDILMLCALADYFHVTTDELLGRMTEKKYAIIAASSYELGRKIEMVANRHGVLVKKIYESCDEALAALREAENISYIITSLGYPLSQEKEKEIDEAANNITHINVECDPPEDGVLSGVELYFENIEAFNLLAKKGSKLKTHK